MFTEIKKEKYFASNGDLRILSSKICSEACFAAFQFLRQQGFVNILPTIISPISDPLQEIDRAIRFKIYEGEYQLTKSMILHKQIALNFFDRIFFFSPNIRIEDEIKRNSGRHLLEFVQLDLEAADWDRDKTIEIAEKLLCSIFQHIESYCSFELKKLKRKLPPLQLPFSRISWQEAFSRFGPDFETALSSSISQPVWVTDFPLEEREFYDREDETRPGWLVDMDLIYPEGFGEAISGGEREYQLEKILQRLKKKAIATEKLAFYLEVVAAGIRPSAGFGIGIERLVRFLCGIREIEYCRIFAKLPGEYAL